MSAGCTGVPLSWLQLERLALGELGGAAQSAAEAHLAACAACHGLLDSIRADAASPPAGARAPTPLPAARVEEARAEHAARRRGSRYRRGAGALFAMAAAAAVVLVVGRGHEGDELSMERLPAARVRVKGGELAVTLVRERDGQIETGASVYQRGDRFKVLLTCPPPSEPWVEVTVIDGREVSRPLGEARPLSCANAVALPGAFALDGDGPVAVCVTLRGDGSRRDDIPWSPIDGETVCARLEAAASALRR